MPFETHYLRVRDDGSLCYGVDTRVPDLIPSQVELQILPSVRCRDSAGLDDRGHALAVSGLDAILFR